MKCLIVNADDLGYSQGINEGIIEAHSKGVVTSTSLMVKGKAVKHGINLAKRYSQLGLGLHFQIEDDDLSILRGFKNATAIIDIERIKKEFDQQVETFQKMTGKLPDHIDGHHHAHRLLRIYQYVKSYSKKNNIPLRGDINFIRSYFGKPNINNLSSKKLIIILNNIPDGFSELMCHPGFVTDDLKSSYAIEREVELQTLKSKEIKDEINHLKIQLVNWRNISLW